MSHQISTRDDITVLIPAAGRVPEGLVALSNITCTAMIPVAGRPVIYWTLTYLRSLGLRKFCIAVPQRGLFVEDFVDCTVGRECQVSFMVPPAGPTGGVGETVASLLDYVDTGAALVVLGDTYFQFADAAVLDRDEPFVLTSAVEESYRWCIAETDATGRISALRDKQKNLPPPLNALIGVYFFPNAAMARRTAREVVHSPGADSSVARARIELMEVLERMRSRTPIRALQAGEWLDCGNPDRQAASHVALLQKREFNELSIDRTLSTITKKSRMKAKFLDEINYLRLLPPDLAVLFPRVVDYSLDWDSPRLTMEYYGYGTLAEAFVYENLDAGIWRRIFEHLYKILTNAFMRYRQPISADAIVDMYLLKTARRVSELQGGEDTMMMKGARGGVRVNGRACSSLESVWPRIEQDVRKLAAGATASVIHGDLCFSNILYDVRSQICKLVDARGSFGGAGIMGDPRYDVAKLYHSVLGLYDFITNDLFHVRVSEADGTVDVALDVRTRPLHRQIRQQFDDVFFGPQAVDADGKPYFNKREILLIMGLIFAGIPALHYDKPLRQAAMYATALDVFAELYPPE